VQGLAGIPHLPSTTPEQLRATNIVIHDRTHALLPNWPAAIRASFHQRGRVCKRDHAGEQMRQVTAGRCQWKLHRSHDPGATGSVSFEVRIAP